MNTHALPLGSMGSKGHILGEISSNAKGDNKFEIIVNDFVVARCGNNKTVAEVLVLLRFQLHKQNT